MFVLRWRPPSKRENTTAHMRQNGRLQIPWSVCLFILNQGSLKYVTVFVARVEETFRGIGEHAALYFTQSPQNHNSLTPISAQALGYASFQN